MEHSPLSEKINKTIEVPNMRKNYIVVVVVLAPVHDLCIIYTKYKEKALTVLE